MFAAIGTFVLAALWGLALIAVPIMAFYEGR